MCKRTTRTYVLCCFIISIFMCLLDNPLLAQTSLPPRRGLQVIIRGISGAELANVQARVEMLQHETTYTDLNAARQHLLFLLPSNILEALKPFGYFDATLTHTLRQQRPDWIATYTITQGPPVMIRHIQLEVIGEGKDLSKLRKHLTHFPLQVGQRLRTKPYEAFRDQFVDLAHRLGFLDAAAVVHQIAVNRQARSANIHLVFDTGKRFSFGAVTFSETTFADAFLQRYVRFKPGQHYSYDKLLKLQDDLSRSNYFQRVVVSGTRSSAVNYIVPIDVFLLPQKSHVYSIGAGYGTDTGPRLSLGWDWRWLNPYGHYLTALVSASTVQNSVMARYVIPGKNPLRENYSIFTGAQHINVRGHGRSFTQQIGAAYQKQFDRWTSTMSLNFQHEQSAITDNDTTTETNSRYLMPSLSLQYLNGNKPFFPTEGYRANLTVRGASTQLLSSTNFAQVELGGRFVYPLTDYQRILARAEVGYTIGTQISDLPYSLNFWAGGVQSVRGYRYRSLGPGRYLLTGSLELHQKIYHQLYGAVFYDIGNAFNNFPFPKKRATGIGLGWLTPIGAIQLSYAQAIDEPGKPHRIQLSIGPLL